MLFKLLLRAGNFLLDGFKTISVVFYSGFPNYKTLIACFELVSSKANTMSYVRNVTEIVICLYCFSKLKYTGSKSNMTFHVQQHHPSSTLAASSRIAVFQEAVKQTLMIPKQFSKITSLVVCNDVSLQLWTKKSRDADVP